jgi:hypothetical protein
MKLLVKVVEAKYSDTPQIAILDMTPEFFTVIQKLMSKAPVKIKMENGVCGYFYADRKDLPALVKATEGRVADWDEFTHLLLEDEFWSCNWQKMEVHDPCMVFDNSGLYIEATDDEGFDYLTAPLTQSDLAFNQIGEKPAFLGATA